MEKEQNTNSDKIDTKDQEIKEGIENPKTQKEEKNTEEKNPEVKVLELEDKLARTFAEMENQRRRSACSSNQTAVETAIVASSRTSLQRKILHRQVHTIRKMTLSVRSV